jgi:hypothetical protein
MNVSRRPRIEPNRALREEKSSYTRNEHWKTDGEATRCPGE